MNFTDQLEEILHYYSQYKKDQQELVLCLREVQEAAGFISNDAVEQISAAMDIAPAAIRAIIKMYPSLKEQKNQVLIVACTGQRCASKEAAKLLQVLQNFLHIKPGQTTKDGRFTLRTQNCMHHCATSPNLKFGDTLYENVTEPFLIALLKEKLAEPES